MFKSYINGENLKILCLDLFMLVMWLMIFLGEKKKLEILVDGFGVLEL